MQSKDNVEISDQGINFDVTVGDGDSTEVVTIVLRDYLQGLNMKVREGNTQSQAALFAQRAVRAGHTSEDTIRAAYPNVKPEHAFRLIEMWGNQTREERVAQTIAAAMAEGRHTTPNQHRLAKAVIEECRKHNWGALANQIENTLVVDEVTEGGRFASVFSLINKAQMLLPDESPQSRFSLDQRDRERRAVRNATTPTTNEGDASPGVENEEPF